MAAEDTITVTICDVALRGAFGSGVPDLISSTTTNYFQRVYDDGTGGYCYYTKTTIDATPSSGETTPNYTGTISDHAVVKVIVSS